MSVIISGLPPSKGGVGRLVSYLISQNKKVIYKGATDSIKKSFYSHNYMICIISVIKRILFEIKFFIEVVLSTGKDVILIHPQSIGYVKFIYLIIFCNSRLYVMDCSFFCIKSYNYHIKAHGECLRCLKFNNKPFSDCIPSPVKMQVLTNLLYLKIIYRLKCKIKFLAQNQSQSRLLKEHFGQKINIEVVGLNTGELDMDISVHPIVKKYDVVFHGSLDDCKGLIYFLKFARFVPQLKFFVPYSKEDVLKSIKEPSLVHLSNTIYYGCHWETGLKSIVKNSTVTMVPSCWSMPIEGALIKSLYYGRFVIVKKTKYGYDNDLFDSESILYFDDDLYKCKLKLFSVLSKSDELIDSGSLENRRIQVLNSYCLKGV